MNGIFDSAHIFDLLMETKIPISINIITADLKFARVSKNTLDHLRLPRHKVEGKYCYDILGQYKDDPTKNGRERICDDCAVLRVIQSGRDAQMIREMNNNIVSHIHAFPLKEKNKIVAVIEVIEVISDKIIDPLTGIFNYRFFEEVLSQECYKASRVPTLTSLIVIDLNNFKQVNDNYGHLQGDKVLREIAQVMNNEIRKSDKLCRLGGDEFAIISPDSDIEKSTILLHRLNEIVSEKFKSHKLSFSFGVAEIPTDSSNPHKLRKIADRRLYAQKDIKNKSKKVIFKTV